jgi:hypothetical protein
MKPNAGMGKAFTFHGSYQSLILARRKEKDTPGSFIHASGGRYYVLKPKRIKANPGMLSKKFKAGDRVRHRRYKKELGTVVRASGYALRVRWDDGETSEVSTSEVIHSIIGKTQKNPRRGVLIYGQVLKIFARKTTGPYKGQDFVHKFKKGALMFGMPDGSIRIVHP